MILKPSLVWFGQLLDRWKWIIFKIRKNSYFAKFAKFRIKNQFFLLDKQYQRKFLFYTLIALLILNTEFGLIWKTHWPDGKELFLKFSKILNSRNSQNSVWKPNFFPRQAMPNTLFAVHSHCTVDTQYRVWFDLKISLTRWNWLIFRIRKISHLAKFAKFRMKTQFFSLGKLYQTLFLLYTLIALVILNTEFLFWFGKLIDPMKKNYF